MKYLLITILLLNTLSATDNDWCTPLATAWAGCNAANKFLKIGVASDWEKTDSTNCVAKSDCDSSNYVIFRSMCGTGKIKVCVNPTWRYTYTVKSVLNGPAAIIKFTISDTDALFNSTTGAKVLKLYKKRLERLCTVTKKRTASVSNFDDFCGNDTAKQRKFWRFDQTIFTQTDACGQTSVNEGSSTELWARCGIRKSGTAFKNLMKDNSGNLTTT